VLALAAGELPFEDHDTTTQRGKCWMVTDSGGVCSRAVTVEAPDRLVWAAGLVCVPGWDHGEPATDV